nr:hypothetical protein [Escherichia coli]
MPVPYGEMLVGSRRISQDISTRDEGWWREGGGYRAAGVKHKKSRSVWRLREQKMKINHRGFVFIARKNCNARE